MERYKIIDTSKPVTESGIRELISREPAGDHVVYTNEALGQAQGAHHLARCAAALANASGGVIVVGVRDGEEGNPEIVGLAGGRPDEDAVWVERAIGENTHPAIDAYAVPVRLSGGRHLVVVEVARSLNSPHRAGGVYPRRVGREVQLMAPEARESVDRTRARELGELRARARDMVLGHRENGIIPGVQLNGVRGAFLYVASIPAVLSGRGVDLRLPEGGLRMQVAGQLLGVTLGPEGVYSTKGATRLPGAFALASREGDALFASLDARAFEAGATTAMLAIDKIETFVLEGLERNLPTLESAGFVAPYYAALVFKPDRPAQLAGRGLGGYAAAPFIGVVDPRSPMLVDGVVPLAMGRRVLNGGERATLPLIERLRRLAGYAS